MQVYDSSNERRQKKIYEKKKAKEGANMEMIDNQSGIEVENRIGTRKSKRRSNNNNIVTESPIHEINISDINEDNCDKMLDKVLEF